MGRSDSLVWGGKEGEGARAGIGAANIIDNQAYNIVKDALSRAERDRRIVDNQERRRVEYGQMANIKLEGWDVDIQRQFGERLNSVKQYFIKAMSTGRNPLDPKNTKEFSEYSALSSSLEADMMASTGQQEFYIKNLTKLTADRNKNFHFDKSMANLNKYRDASVAEREKMGGTLLIARNQDPIEIMQNIINDRKRITNEGQWYYDERGNLRQTEVTSQPIETKAAVLEVWKSDTDRGSVLRSHYPTPQDIDKAYNKIAPSPSYRYNIKTAPASLITAGVKQKALDDKIDVITREVGKMTKGNQAVLNKLQGTPYKGLYINEARKVKYPKDHKDYPDKNLWGKDVIEIILSKQLSGGTKDDIAYIDISPGADQGFRALWDLYKSAEGTKSEQVEFTEFLKKQRREKQSGKDSNDPLNIL